MQISKEEEIKDQLIQKAQEFGACAAGIAAVEAVKQSPSHLIYGKIGDYQTVGNKEGPIKPGQVLWPADAESAIVIAVEHAQATPDKDWWIEGYNGGTPGNRMLISINTKLSQWLQEEHGINTTKLRYHIEDGGILLKDAAVLAGLGCIGKNNMLVTRQFGPRIRLRALLTDAVLPSTDPVEFDPCEDCHMPCRTACPQGAFQDRIFSKKKFSIDQLPARTGVFSRSLCNRQMMLDENKSEQMNIESQDGLRRVVKYCRLCEFSCPVGRPSP
jgi:epoxyqueuosine reductase